LIRFGFFLLLTLFGANAIAQPLPDRVEAYLRKKMGERHIPGLQVAVVQHEKIVFTAAYGSADIEHSVAVTKQTLFSIASMTKAFTGVAIMQLVEEGRVDLDAPVSHYLSDLPTAWQGVTIRQLLTHVSGIPDIVDPSSGKIVGDGSPQTFLAKASSLPMDFATGDRFNYNQTNYLLLGRVIEKLSGKSFAQFVTARQLDIAGMRNTSFGGFSDIVKDRAQPYALRPGVTNQVDANQWINIFYESVPSLVAGNGLNTSAEQAATWIIALQKGRLLKAKESLATLWTPGVLNNGTHGGFGGALNGYALGWPVITRPTHRAVAPIGGNWAAIFVYPDDDLSIVVLTNLQGAHPESFVDELAGYFVGDIRNASGFGIPHSIETLQAELVLRGFDRAVEIVDAPRNKDMKTQLSEADVNAWGYRLMGKGQRTQALEVFKMNVHLYPTSGNAYDSLADAYENAGNRNLAIENYKESLRLSPNNQNAAQHLKDWAAARQQ